MAESGVIGKYSLTPQVDVRVQLYDMMGNLLAARPLRQQQFLFAHTVEPVAGGARPEQRAGGSAVVGVKQHEELLLYGVSAAPQAVDGLALGAAGSVHPPSSIGRLGIAMKPLFSFAGLGYVQSGKPYKKFFCEDGTHHFVILSGQSVATAPVRLRPQGAGGVVAPVDRSARSYVDSHEETLSLLSSVIFFLCLLRLLLLLQSTPVCCTCTVVRPRTVRRRRSTCCS